VRRATFVASATAWACGSAAAEATGGRDVDNAAVAHEMRVLLASDAGRPPAAEAIDAYQFRWNGRTYRGHFESAALPDGRIGLVNVVPLDAYLYGVVSKEVSAGWPRAAQETQAIVARTYALGKQRPGKPYDVLAGESDQVYGGVDAESVEAREAVDATAGVVVTYAGAAAQIAFGSCCGGHTADAAELWGHAYPYLRGVADPHCVIAPEYHWQRDVPYDEFIRALGAAAASVGSLQRIELRDLDGTGRARRVALVGDRETVELKTTAFRTALGTSLVRSSLVQSVQIERSGGGGTVVIAGSGRGHGVGLCQWGARAMASEGSDATQIVQFYFPQTALGRA
jgi:stage II sporulation protein D